MWYYTIGDEEIGPIPAAELKALAQDGTIGPNTQVWKEGTAEWTTAGKIKGLIPARKKKPQQQRQRRQVVEDYDEYGGYDDDDYGASNPYSSPRDRGRSRGGRSRGGSKSRGREYDVFTYVFIIADIVLCLLRAVLFVLGLLAVLAFANVAPPSAWVEVVFNGLIFILGMGAAIAILRKSQAGVILGWVTLGLTALSCVFSIFQLISGAAVLPAMQQGPNADARMAGAMVGGGCVLFVRVGLLVCYGIAVKKASDVLNR